MNSLMARLDQMSTTKQVAQIASVIGRTFALDLLAAMTSLPAHELRGALERLVSAEVLFHADLPQVVRYAFKHALLQDVAYQSLLKSVRQRYHLRLARILEEQFPAEAQSQPELLAHHFAEAGQPNAAIAYWLAAGKRATERSANREAQRSRKRRADLTLIVNSCCRFMRRGCSASTTRACGASSSIMSGDELRKLLQNPPILWQMLDDPHHDAGDVLANSPI